MTYRSAENKIREIMAQSFLKESTSSDHMNPANKTTDAERVNSALKVLHDNGCPSAKAKDGGIEVNAMDANRAADVLDHAIAKSVIDVRPTLVSAEAIPMPEPHVPDPVSTPVKEGVNDPNIEVNQGKVDETGHVEIKQPKSLHSKMENRSKKIDEDLNRIGREILNKSIKTPKIKEETSARRLTSEEVNQIVTEGKSVFHVMNGKTTVKLGDNHERVWTHNGHDLYRNKEDVKDHMLLRRDHSVHSMFHGDTKDVKDMIKGAGLTALRTGLDEHDQLNELSTETLHKVANVARKKGRKDVLDAAIRANKRNRAKPEYKFVPEEEDESSSQQLDELSLTALIDYKKAAAKTVRPTDAISRRLEKRINGISTAKSKIAKKISKALFGENVAPVNMLLRVRKNITEHAVDGDPKPKLRLKATVVSDSGKHTAKIYKNHDWNEHTVKFFIHGKHHEPADYGTNDYHDAHGTACLELKRLDKLNGALKEETLEDIQSFLDEEGEQIDELSKALIGRYVKVSANTMRDHEFDRTDLSHRDLSRANGGFTKLRKLNRDVQNRWKGISTGVDKLTGAAKVPAKD